MFQLSGELCLTGIVAILERMVESRTGDRQDVGSALPAVIFDRHAATPDITVRRPWSAGKVISSQ